MVLGLMLFGLVGREIILQPNDARPSVTSKRQSQTPKIVTRLLLKHSILEFLKVIRHTDSCDCIVSLGCGPPSGCLATRKDA